MNNQITGNVIYMIWFNTAVGLCQCMILRQYEGSNKKMFNFLISNSCGYIYNINNNIRVISILKIPLKLYRIERRVELGNEIPLRK